MKTPKNLAGKRFGKLTVISLSDKKVDGCVLWNCVCDCGKHCVKRSIKLSFGSTISCGCLMGKTSFTHKRSKTTEYRIWTNMKTRCYNPKNKFFHRYGGRGIVMCDQWLNSFEHFLADMGLRPSPKHTLDRENNNGIYEKSNCRWATYRQQQNNRCDNVHIEYFGVPMTIAEAGRVSHIKTATIRRRLKLGWNVNDAMSIPVS